MGGFEFMSWQDKCAVMGVWNHEEAAFLTYLGLYALQHRGQEGAGIVSLFQKQHLSHKNQGLVGEVFSRSKLKELKGRAAIGHTRYSTTGADELKNIQPFTQQTDFGTCSIAHNGNIVNHQLLKKKFNQDKEGLGSDSECLFFILNHFKEKDIVSALEKHLSLLEGAYSFVLLTEEGLIAMRDPMGFRPLVLGRKGETHVVASETCALDLIGAEYVREVAPGEILFIGDKGLKSYFLPKAKKKALCIFEYVYFSRPDSFVFEQSVYERRKTMGQLLAKEHPVDADLVIPVPDSGVPAALGYAQESGLPFEMGIIRNHYIGRTFIHPSPHIRDFKVKIKLNPQASLLKGKRLVVVDDSIVRGTTSKSLIQVLRQVGAKEVHLRVSSPPIKSPCFYGVDTPQKKQLAYRNYSNIKELQEYLKADSLAYLSYENLIKSGGDREFCLACFDEKYPTPLYGALND